TESQKSIFLLILMLLILWLYWIFLSLLKCIPLLQRIPIYTLFPKVHQQHEVQRIHDIGGLPIKTKFGSYLVFFIIWASIESPNTQCIGRQKGQMDQIIPFLSICHSTAMKTFDDIFMFRLPSLQKFIWKLNSFLSFPSLKYLVRRLRHLQNPHSLI